MQLIKGLSVIGLLLYYRDTLAELVKLETLQVAHNDLTYIDGDACKTLNELRNVDLSYNQLTLKHPNNSMSILLDCKNIVDANLSHNKISRIFGDWLYKSQLRNLNLEYNDIHYVSVRIVNFTELPIHWRIRG